MRTIINPVINNSAASIGMERFAYTGVSNAAIPETAAVIGVLTALYFHLRLTACVSSSCR